MSNNSTYKNTVQFDQPHNHTDIAHLSGGGKSIWLLQELIVELPSHTQHLNLPSFHHFREDQ